VSAPLGSIEKRNAELTLEALELRLNAGWLKCNESAARAKLTVSASATTCWRRRRFTAVSNVASNALKT